MKKTSHLSAAILLCLTCLFATQTASAGTLYVWGSESTVPQGGDFIDISVGFDHSLAIRADGSIEAWGANGKGQLNLPEGNDYTAVAAGKSFSIAIQDGSLVGVGDDSFGRLDLPAGDDFVEIAASTWISVARRQNGTIAIWGWNPPVAPTGNDFTMVACGIDSSYPYVLALKEDTSLQFIGNSSTLKSQTPTDTGYIAVASGEGHCMALKDDGTIVAWGKNIYGQISGTPEEGGFIAIAAGDDSSAAIAADGSIVSWGKIIAAPPQGNNFVALAVGQDRALAMEELGTITLTSPNGGQYFIAGSTSDIAWTSEGDVTAVDIEYSADDGSTWTTVATGQPNTGSYQWQIPSVESQQCLVRVKASPVAFASDLSDAVFTIHICTLKSDTNNDCVIDIEDFAQMALEWLSTQNPAEHPVSFDDDADVDIDDFNIFMAAWLSKLGDDNYNADCDINLPPDNAIDMKDYAEFSEHWLQGQ